MRFKPGYRTLFEDTRRKRLAAQRAQQRERDRFPLLAATIAETQLDLDTLMDARATSWAEQEAQRRNNRARLWRRGRQQLDRLDSTTRRTILNYWNNHRWLPGDPSYFLDMLHSIEAGRLIYDGETYHFAKPLMTRAEIGDHIPSHKPPVLPGITRQRRA